MNNKNLVLVIIVCFLFQFISCSQKEKPKIKKEKNKVKLRMNMKKGIGYKFKTITDQKIIQELQEKKQVIKQKIETGLIFLVEEITGNEYLIKVTYDYINFEQKIAGIKNEYDSRKKEEKIPVNMKPFEAITGSSFKIKMTDRGRVEEVQGISELLDKIISSIDISDEKAKKIMARTMKNQFGDEAIKEMMEGMTAAYYPENRVGVGDKWSNSFNLSKGMPMKINNSISVTSLKDNWIVLKIKSSIAPNPEAESLDLGTTKMTYELSGTQEGTVEFDAVKNWPIKSRIKQVLQGKLKLAPSEKMPKGMVIPVKITGDIIVEPI